MARFDGTGPRGNGPLTGRGDGYCVLRLPKPGSNDVVTGYTGLQATPVSAISGPATWGAGSRLTTPPLGVWPSRILRRCRKGGRRGGRCFGRRGW